MWEIELNLKSNKKLMYVAPLYYTPAGVFFILLLPALFEYKEGEYIFSDFIPFFIICTFLILIHLAIHFFILVPIGKCDITIDRTGICSDKIKCKSFAGYIDWKSIESVYIFTLGRGPNYIYLYLNSGYSTQKIRIPFDFVTESTREIEEYIAQYAKLRRNYL